MLLPTGFLVVNVVVSVTCKVMEHPSLAGDHHSNLGEVNNRICAFFQYLETGKIWWKLRSGVYRNYSSTIALPALRKAYQLVACIELLVSFSLESDGFSFTQIRGLHRSSRLAEAASRWQQEHTWQQEKLQWTLGRKREVVWLPLCGFHLDCHWGTEGIIISWIMKQQGVLQRTQIVKSDTPDFESWCHSWQRFWSW